MIAGIIFSFNEEIGIRTYEYNKLVQLLEQLKAKLQ